MELTIDGIDYLEIGEYVDNGDGIMAYMPDPGSDLSSWITFFEDESSLILVWSLNCIREMLYAEKNEKIVLESGGEALVQFLRKYYDYSEFSHHFEDFAFGPYSPNGSEYGELPEIIYNNKVVDTEDMDEEGIYIDYKVFIQKSEYEEFNSELANVVDLIVKNLEEHIK